MTDPTGRIFVSYRRKRLREVKVVVQALHDHGIPAWQDITDLDAEPTPEELRRVLRDPATAAALLWITPEVEDSPIIRKIEVPEAMGRKKDGDGFFVQPVAAGGLNYDEAATIAGEYLGVDDLKRWNLEKVQCDPVDEAEAARIAELVLRRRLKEINRHLDPDEPLRIDLYTRGRAPLACGAALSLDWSARFEGRTARPGAWDDRLLPSLTAVSAAVRELGPGHRVEAGGLCSLSAAMAFGAAFLAPIGVEIGWRQRRVGCTDQVWSLSAPREVADLDITLVEDDIASEDMAVLVSIGHDVQKALKNSRGEVPSFRGYVCVNGPEHGQLNLLAPGQAADAAYRILEAVNAARRGWRDIRQIHFFLATPVGLAVLLGQLINGLGPVYTYEHLPVDAIGAYRRAALLHPGA